MVVCRCGVGLLPDPCHVAEEVNLFFARSNLSARTALCLPVTRDACAESNVRDNLPTDVDVHFLKIVESEERVIQNNLAMHGVASDPGLCSEQNVKSVFRCGHDGA